MRVSFLRRVRSSLKKRIWSVSRALLNVGLHVLLHKRYRQSPGGIPTHSFAKAILVLQLQIFATMEDGSSCYIASGEARSFSPGFAMLAFSAMDKTMSWTHTEMPFAFSQSQNLSQCCPGSDLKNGSVQQRMCGGLTWLRRGSIPIL